MPISFTSMWRELKYVSLPSLKKAKTYHRQAAINPESDEHDFGGMIDVSKQSVLIL